jgi:opacity protein-like surface antigen
MKSYFSAVFAVIFSTIVLMGPAHAKTYTSMYGGLNWNDVASSPFVDDETGSVVGATLGKTVDAVPGLRVELDGSYRTNDVNLFGGFISASHDTTSLMANAVYDFPVALVGGGVPYALVGVGVSHTEATFENVSLLKLENTDLAWQLGTGVNWQVAEGVKAGLGYRYMAGPELEVLGAELSDGTNHSAVATVTFDLN